MPAPDPAPLKIVIIEDNPMLLSILKDMLTSIPNLSVEGNAASEQSAIEMLRDKLPHLAIVDLELSPGSGLKVLQAIHENPDQFEGLQTVVFSNHAHSVVQARCLSLGAEAFFDKSFQMDELLDFVQQKSEAQQGLG